MSQVGGGVRVCVSVRTQPCVSAHFFPFMDEVFPFSSPVLDQKVLFRKVRATGCLQIFNEKTWVITLRLRSCVSVHFLLDYCNEITENNVSWPSRMCIILAIYFFFPISSKWSQWLLCISLEKLKDMNIFLAPSIEKDRQKWLAYWEQPALCDEESVRFAEDLKTMMRTRALSKWVLMKSCLQENTFLCVLHSACLVQVCRGGQRNFKPYLVVTAVLIVNRAGKKDGQGVQTRNIK